MPNAPAATRRLAHWLIAGAVLIGALLRFAWPLDIEYKLDESFMFRASQNIGRTEAWPMLGLGSGGGVRNPPLSIWVFVGAARLFGIDDPVSLAMIVAGAGVAALALLTLMAFRAVDPAERTAWLWGIALGAVNPNQVQLQRKIWAQSILPVFSAAFLFAWFYRRNVVAAFCWGMLGVILGQIHLSGFFFAIAVAVWTGWSDRHSPNWRMWVAWVAGSLVGCIPMLSWLVYLVQGGITQAAPAERFRWILKIKFWVLWVFESGGLGMNWTLGTPDYFAFVRNPVVAIAHLAAVLCLAAVLLAVLRSWLPDHRHKVSGDTGSIVEAAFWGLGILMTLSGVIVYRHYLIVAFPLVSVWFARAALQWGKRGTAILCVAWLSQLVISLMFLFYIHTNQGAAGDYGVAFRSQSPGQQGK